MVRDNFHGTLSTLDVPEPFELLFSFEEDNIPIARSRHGGHAVSFESFSRGGGRGGGHCDNDGNDERYGVTPHDSFLEDLD